MAMIEIVDRFLSKEEFDYVLNYCESASYTYGEVDSYGLPPTGMVHQISEIEDIYKLFKSKTEKLVSGIELYRMYINCFAPSENPYFHTDGDRGDITFLYYPTTRWELNDGGETQFVVNNEIYGVTPVPNRMIYFDASVLHRATAFRNKHRFTIAIKYGTLS
jgi:Rps23 Pro-64 3,4-dihydroxylase Tpa1-like proline 4-hydroxylase